MKNRKNLFGRNLGMLIAAAFFTLVDCIPLQAQNVTISPQTGNLIAGLTEGEEVGYEQGWSSMWRHEQLPLTLTVSDYGNLTDAGQLVKPAGNIIDYNGQLVITGGMTRDCYIALTLPKGFRFTGYRAVILNNVNGKNISNTEIGSNNYSKNFYETNEGFDHGNYLAIARNSSGSATMANNSNSNTEYIIQRTSMSADDMGNTLYFKLVHRDGNYFYGVTIKSFEVFFTAEGDFTEKAVPMSPTSISAEGVSYVETPFATSKLDIGAIKPNKKNNSTYYSYDYRNVEDLKANLMLYQEDAVSGGIPGDYASDKCITSVNQDGQNYYALKNNTYFVETPVEMKTKDNITLYQGYRIVGATINYVAENNTKDVFSEKKYDNFYIATNVGYNTTYYLSSEAGVTTSIDEAGLWFMDDEGYIRLASNPDLYLKNQTVDGTTNRLAVVSLPERPAKFTKDGNNIKLGNGNLYLRLHYSESGFIITTKTYDYFFMSSSNTYAKATTYNSGTQTTIMAKTGTETLSGSPNYTLKVYDKTGEKVLKEVSVKAGDKDSIEINGLNNDAVKFEISNLENGTFRALVNIDVTMQALNPYINSMTIVCQEKSGNGRKLTQQFTANDFAVRGGKFTFYVPTDFEQPCLFTFEDLKSNYGDETYYNNTDTTHYSRYNFVKSPYWTNTTSLYENYDPDHTYTDKVVALVAGKSAFRFNNADELSNTSTDTQTRHLEEYPFSLQAYGNDNFKQVIIDQGETDKAYLFTCDETRYNIAPTNKLEHRYYAFYLMEVELNKKSYDPTFTWERIYDEGKTYYVDNNNQRVTKSQWGLKLGTTASTDDGKPGYLMVSQIIDEISKACKEGNTNAPESSEQILYIDGSDLQAVVENEVKDVTTGEVSKYELKQIIENLGANAIVYLPEGTTANVNNFAFKNVSGTFDGAADFILTDRKPFYAPYDIQLAAERQCTYKRILDPAKNGTEKRAVATVILPFVLTVDKGVHTNADGSKPFSVHEMKADNCIGPKDEQDDTQNVYFPAIEDGLNKTEANRPYIIKILNVEEQDSKVPFVATQKGTTIIASTKMDEENYTFEGQSSVGTTTPTAKTPVTATYNFQSLGTYAGTKLMIDDPVNYFYFAHNYLVCTKNLDKDLECAKILPFRTYYPTTTTKSATFAIVFGEGEGNTDPTGINNVDETPDLVVAPGVGTITMASTIEQGVKIYNMNGVLVDKVVMGAGETKTVNLPAGMYIVNGTKLIVR